MQRSYFLLKFFIVLAAVAVQLRVSLPSYSIMLGMNRKGVTITVTRANASREHKKDEVALLSSPGTRATGDPAVAGSGKSGTGPRDSTPATPGSSSAAQAPVASPSGSESARIEFMNIARDGTSVLAGRAAPGAHVTVYENNVAIGTVTAGADGDWSLATEHRFASADPSGSLSASIALAAPEAAKDNKAPPGAATSASSQASTSGSKGPAAELIKEFAKTVEAARKEAAQKSAQERAQESSEPETRQTAAETQVQTSTSASLSPAPPTESVASPSRSDASPPTVIARAETAAAPGDLASRAPPEPTIIPIPMQFVYRETSLTDDGRKAAALLLDYLKLKKFDAVTLSGHADERGTEEFNMELSRGRLEAVVELLRKGGYEGAVKILPKGESEPFAQVDRSRFGHEDLMQLDRRVELRVAR